MSAGGLHTSIHRKDGHILSWGCNDDGVAETVSLSQLMVEIFESYQNALSKTVDEVNHGCVAIRCICLARQ